MGSFAVAYHDSPPFRFLSFHRRKLGTKKTGKMSKKWGKGKAEWPEEESYYLHSLKTKRVPKKKGKEKKKHFRPQSREKKSKLITCAERERESDSSSFLLLIARMGNICNAGKKDEEVPEIGIGEKGQSKDGYGKDKVER